MAKCKNCRGQGFMRAPEFDVAGANAMRGCGHCGGNGEEPKPKKRGRPKLDKAKKRRTYAGAYLTATEKARLDTIAKHSGRKTSVLVRGLILEFLEKHERTQEKITKLEKTP